MSTHRFFQRVKTISFKRYPVAFLSLFLLSFLLTLYLFNRFLYAPKILFLCIIILAAIFLGKLQVFLKDWFVFLSFLYLSDSLRGFIYYLICKFNFSVYTLYAINAEKFLFGNIPSVVFQKTLLSNNTSFSWFEKSLTVLHGTHFIAFLFVGLIIWIHKSNYFLSYKMSFYLMISIGILSYFVIPTAPPWIASHLFRIIPEITHFNIILDNMVIPDLTSGFNTNPVAAMPSLHAAFPALCSLILWHLYRWRSSFFHLYTLLIFFTIVYTGDHYVVDIIAGVLLAFICYYFSIKVKVPDLKPAIKIARLSKKEKSSFIRRKNHLILGLLILALGISTGFAIKDQLIHKFNQENVFIPKYVDFFNHEENYRENYYVQIYFGNHHLAKENIKKALLYFEHALSLSKNTIEKTQAEMKIKQCHILRGRREAREIK